jgi:hypothetical protein
MIYPKEAIPLNYRVDGLGPATQSKRVNRWIGCRASPTKAPIRFRDNPSHPTPIHSEQHPEKKSRNWEHAP